MPAPAPRRIREPSRPTAAGVPLVSLLVGAVVFLLGVGGGAGAGVRVLAAASLADAARAIEPERA